jgi:hypothetical protein
MASTVDLSKYRQLKELEIAGIAFIGLVDATPPECVGAAFFYHPISAFWS